jgi:hypothetical protein
MKAKSTLLADGIKAALQGIRIDAGYLTDLGLSVRRGFYAHILKDSKTVFPAVVIHPGSETPQEFDRGGTKGRVRIEVPIVIAVELSLDEEAYDTLQAAMADVRRALLRARDQLGQLGQGGSLEVTEAIPNLSDNSKFALGAMTAVMNIVETY